jgi:lipoate-protein ligase A
MEATNVARGKITSIDRELERRISVEEATQALKEGFSQALNIELAEGKMMPFELKLAENLQKEKYSKDDWNFRGKTTFA